MVRYTWQFYLLLLSFIVILQLEFVSSSKPKSGRRMILLNWFTSHKNKKLSFNTTENTKLSSKDVPGFSLTEDEIRKFNIWPNGFIPYYIDVPSFSDKVLRDKIRSFLNMVNGMTSLNFVEMPSPPENDHTRWVFFINRRGLLGCGDHSVWNFTSEGVQRVVLGYDCMNKEGELAEAVLAIAGVPAQHTAPNRDEYIEVFLDNVIPDKRKLFEKLSDHDWLFHDLPYDYNSVGHYHNFKYSMNGKTVIQPRKPDITIGENKDLSEIDIVKIKLLYNYITQKQQLNVPECQKLFKTGSKFNSFVPDKFIARPIRKSPKYTGLQPNKNNSVEYTDDEKASSEPVEDNEDQGIDSDHKGKPNITSAQSSEDSNDKIREKMLLTEKKKKRVSKKEKHKKKQDLLASLSDDHSGEIKLLKIVPNGSL